MNDETNSGSRGLLRRIETDLDKHPRLARDVAGLEDFILVIQSVQIHSDRQLPQIGETLHPLALLFGRGQGRKKHCRKDGDDRDDDQQFYEGEGNSARNARIDGHIGER